MPNVAGCGSPGEVCRTACHPARTTDCEPGQLAGRSADRSHHQVTHHMTNRWLLGQTLFIFCDESIVIYELRWVVVTRFIISLVINVILYLSKEVCVFCFMTFDTFICLCQNTIK